MCGSLDVTVYRCPPVSVYTEEWVSDMLTNNYRGQKQQDALINEKSVCLDVSVCMSKQEVRMLTEDFLHLFIYIFISGLCLCTCSVDVVYVERIQQRQLLLKCFFCK